MRIQTSLRILFVTAVCLAFAPAAAFAEATITIVNGNAPGVGFNDPTAVAPVGGNTGTTLGQQRLNAFQFAADIWGSTLDSSVEIRILATFEPLTCTASGAVLGSAGTRFILRDFPGAEFDNTWYHSALADKRSGVEQIPGESDIRARFNSSIGTLPGCLTGVNWYLGFDLNHGNNIPLVTVLLHEFAHGLGFSQFASTTTGAMIEGFPDVYNRRILDNTAGLHWHEMTNAQRAASAVNSRRVVFDGPAVTVAVPSVLQPGTPLLRVLAPASIAGIYQLGTASFGPALSVAGVTGTVVQALDDANAAGPSTTDGCTVLTNAAAVAGKIALIDRGTCGFIVKVKNAQNAGATAVLIADNAAGAPPAGLGGTDPTIVIPSGRITLADGATIKAQLGAGVVVTLAVDLTVRAGADELGRALLYTPNPVQVGSTISHWDTIASPNQLMEPAINTDLTHHVEPPFDLTLPLLRDVGWFPDQDLDLVPTDVDQCPASDLRATIFIGGTDTSVANVLFASGCTIADLINNEAAGATNHGGFVSGVAHLLNSLKKAGIISGKDKGIIQSAAARSKA
jgi:hypothetical protein